MSQDSITDINVNSNMDEHDLMSASVENITEGNSYTMMSNRKNQAAFEFKSQTGTELSAILRVTPVNEQEKNTETKGPKFYIDNFNEELFKAMCNKKY